MRETRVSGFANAGVFLCTPCLLLSRTSYEGSKLQLFCTVDHKQTQMLTGVGVDTNAGNNVCGCAHIKGV